MGTRCEDVAYMRLLARLAWLLTLGGVDLVLVAARLELGRGLEEGLGLVRGRPDR